MNNSIKRSSLFSTEKRKLREQFLKEAGVASASTPSIPRREMHAPPPLSFSQQRLWFLEQVESSASAFAIPIVVRLSGTLDPRALHESLNRVIQRHESLRTTFRLVDGQLVQVIHTAMQIALPQIDLRDLPQVEQQAQVQAQITQELLGRFDLAEGPLLRGRLLLLDEQHYVLILILHNIIADRWSSSIFVRELALLYEAQMQGSSAELPELPIQYADYAAWQRAALRGEKQDQLLAYWRQNLAGAPSFLPLPSTRPRPAVQTFNGTNYPLSIPAELTAAIKALSQREGVTLFMLLLAAFKVVLAKYSGHQDLVVGTAVANRSSSQIEGVIGYFINMLALRTSLAGNPSFKELLQRVRETTLGAYAHQDLPFDKLVEALHPERSTNYTPLFQVSFSLQNAPQPDFELYGLKLQVLDIPPLATTFDLSVSIEDTRDELKAVFEYNTDLFDAADIERLGGHFTHVLEHVVAEPERRLATIALLTADEQAQLRQWNATQQPLPAACLHDLILAQAQQQPDAPALICGATVFTYQQVVEQAQHLARHLHARGVGPDVRVGLFLERAPQLVVATLAVLLAGGCYVPLDPGYPAERIQFMLADATPRVVLTQATLQAQVPPTAAQVLAVDALLATEADGPPLSTTVTPEHLAYVIYTSGSTGRPKGVAVRHAGVVNNLRDLNQVGQVGAQDRVLALSALSFDMAVYEGLGLLSAGGAVVLPAATELRDPAAWVRLIQQHRVSVWNSAPALLELLLNTVATMAAPALPTLRVAFLGGDWIGLSQPGRLRQHAPGVQFVALGGATEASIHSVIYTVGKVVPAWRSIPYGRPMVNQETYLLDGDGQAVPVGVVGELYLGGIGLARGYWQQPGLTAERFVPHPYAATPGARLYRTGDLGRWWADGTIELLGRRDHQIKVRGFRVELGEIAAAVEGHADVRRAVVVQQADHRGERQVVGYYVAEPAVEPGALRTYLKQRLPEYMVPAALVPLDAIPLSPNGKLDRSALPAAWQAQPEVQTAYVAPSSETERALAELWTRLLGVEQIGVHDNFFDLGGHSVLGAQLMIQLRARFNKNLPIHSFFDAPTIAELARTIDNS